jgi:hypothetical protein
MSPPAVGLNLAGSALCITVHATYGPYLSCGVLGGLVFGFHWCYNLRLELPGSRWILADDRHRRPTFCWRPSNPGHTQ